MNPLKFLLKTNVIDRFIKSDKASIKKKTKYFPLCCRIGGISQIMIDEKNNILDNKIESITINF